MMMERYQKETSQIHAPAYLIQKTKRAVQEEEKRIEEQKIQSRNADTDTHRYGSKERKWALPVTGAAALFILVNVLAVMSRSQIGMSGGSQADSGAVEEAEGVCMTSEPTEATEDTGGPAVTDSEMPDEEAGLADIDEEMANAGESFAGIDGNATDGSMAGQERELSEMDIEKEMADSAADMEAAKEEISLSVTEVGEVPDFYGNSDTRCVILRGLRFYVSGEQDGIWSAYVHIDRKKYVITGESNQYTGEKEFVEEAYELLMNTKE